MFKDYRRKIILEYTNNLCDIYIIMHNVKKKQLEQKNK